MARQMEENQGLRQD